MKLKNFLFFNSHDLQVVVKINDYTLALATKKHFSLGLKPLKSLSILHDLKVVAINFNWQLELITIK